MANFSLRLLKAVQIQPKAPDPSFCPTTLYSPYVFMGNQNEDAIIIQSTRLASYPELSRWPSALADYDFCQNKLNMSTLAVSKSPQKKDRRKVQQFIKQLMKVWSSKDVQQNYQNYYLTYLDSLPDHLVEIEISREIKKTLQNKSHYFNINKSLALHTTSIAKLQLAVDKLQKQEKVAESDLQYVCELIDELRNNNMLVAQNTLNFNYQSSSKSNSQFGFVHGNNYIFQQLNKDHEFVKSSFLRKYIVFTNSYDPFFLYHYETAKTTNDIKYRSHPSIEKLFNLTISKAYKIMKLQQEILQFLSGKMPAEREKPKRKAKRYNYSLINDKNLYSTVIKQTQDENQTTNRPYNKSFLNKQRSPKQDDYENEALKKRSNTQGEIISSYFQSGIGADKETDRNYLPKITKRESFNITPNPNRSYLQNSRQRRINSIGNEDEAIIPVTLNNSNLKRNSLNIIKKREQDFKNQLPLKYVKSVPVDQEVLRNEQQEIKEMREVYVQVEPPVDPYRDQRYKTNNSEMVHYRGPPVIEGEQFLRSPLNTLKNFKLKAGNLTLHSFFIFLRELNIKEQYRSTFQIGNWEDSVRKSQYYLHKFYINEVLMAISLCCALPEGDIVIKCWAPTTECDPEMSQFLFKKYIQHIQRQTICKQIFYNAGTINQINASGFQMYKPRIFQKQRSLPIQVQYYSYYPFLSLDFNSIAVPRSTNKEILQKIVNSSNVYSPFSEKEFFCSNYLLIINKLINPGQIARVGNYTPNLRNMKEVQTQMIKEQFFFNPYNLDSPVNPINLLTLKMRNPLQSAFFIANRPFIKLTGCEVYSDRESLIVSLQLLKGTILYFGKGFRSIGDMFTVVKNSSVKPKTVEYCVRMFSKRMRGRIHSINLRDEVCFGDLEMVFQWRDFLKGKIQHNFSEDVTFGEKNQSFYCLLEIDGEQIFIFEVTESNFL